MPQWIVPPPLGGLLDNSNASGNAFGNWFSALAGASGDVKKSQATAIDDGVPVMPIAPSDHPNFSSGLPSRIDALAGIDLQNPNRFAPRPLDDGPRGVYRDDPVESWKLQRRR
jgi:hypothetical protein